MIGLKLSNKQPQVLVEIDQSNPITAALVFVSNPAVGYTNLIKPRSPLNIEPIVTSASDKGINSSAGSIEYADTVNVSNGLTLFSILKARPANYLNTDGSRTILSTRTSGNKGWSWKRGPGVGDFKVAQIFTVHGVADYAETNATIGSVEDVPVAVRYNRVTGVISWFANGRPSSNDTAASTSVNVDQGETLHYRRAGPFSAGLESYLDYLNCTLVFERMLSNAEIKSLSENPWQIFKPVERPIYVGYQPPSTSKPLFINKPKVVQTPAQNAQIDWSNSITSALTVAQFGATDVVNNAPLPLDKHTLGPSIKGAGISRKPTENPAGSKLRNGTFKTSNGAYDGDFTVMQFCAPISGNVPQVGIAFGNIDGNFTFSGIAYNALFNLAAPTGEFIGQFIFYTYNGGFNGGNFELRNACDGKPHAFHVRRKGTQMDGGRDGLARVVPSTSTRFVAAANNPSIYIAGGHNAGIGFTDSSVPITLVFNRALSDAEIYSLAQNPFQLLSNSGPEIWINFAGVLPASVVSQLLAQYALRGISVSSAAPNYNVRTTSNTDRALAYMLRTNAAASTIVNYLVRNAVPSDQAINYLIRAGLPVSAVANYFVRTNASSNTVANYLMRTIADSNSTVNYNVRTSAANSASTNYVIRAASSTSSAIAYSIRGILQKAYASSYSVRGELVSSTGSTYNVRTTSTSSNANSYSIRSLVDRSQSIAYNILSAGQVVSNFNITFNTRTNASSSTGLSWFIRSIATSATGLVYTVRANLSSQQQVEYKIYTQASSNTALSYTLRTSLQKQLSGNYSVKGSLAAQRQFNYNVLAPVAVSANLQLLYSILQDLGGDFLDVYIRQNPLLDVPVVEMPIIDIYITQG